MRRRTSPENDGQFLNEARPAVQQRGYLTRPGFLAICHWKTPRSQPLCARNREEAVRVITQAALATSDEAPKMDLLRQSSGVQWPTASALLHFCDVRPYPILDFRALLSLGFAKPPHYAMPFWLEYLQFTRSLATRLSLSIRAVDRAPWQYSKSKQR